MTPEFPPLQQPKRVEQQAMQKGMFDEIQIGAAERTFRANAEGVWSGGESFETGTYKLHYDGKTEQGANGEIVTDPNIPSTKWGTTLEANASTQTFTAGAGGEVVMDGALGQLRTNNIIDQTYGFYGTFATNIKTQNFATSEDFIIAPDSGGLMTAKAAIVSPSPSFLMLDLPSLDRYPVTALYWTIFRDSGNYVLRHHGGTIGAVYTGWYEVIYTVFFNSNEAASGY